MPTHSKWLAPALALTALTPLAAGGAVVGREPVLKQIKVPHSYYYREMYLPQATSGPNAVAWSPDGVEVAVSMQGSLWRVDLASARLRTTLRDPTQLAAHIGGALPSLVGLFGQTSVDYVLERRRRHRLQLRDRLRVLLQNGRGHADAALAFEGALTGRHLVQDRAQREDVAARIGLFALHLPCAG